MIPRHALRLCQPQRAARAILLMCLIVPWSTTAHGADWLAAPSTFTHDPLTAERVSQYSPIGPVYAFPNPYRVQSGYRHIQSTIRAGDAADYLHIVEQWGDQPVRPYGEWQFPFRPYSVPYDLWGPPYVPFPIYPYGSPYLGDGFGPGTPGPGLGGYGGYGAGYQGPGVPPFGQSGHGRSGYGGQGHPSRGHGDRPGGPSPGPGRPSHGPSGYGRP